jgi:ABC-type branched-subunit amino acid transport system substrate-binding protein
MSRLTTGSVSKKVVVSAVGVLCISMSGIVNAAPPASAATKAASDPQPIVVGGDGAIAAAEGIGPGFEAGIYQFNKAGGLGGRKIKFVGFLDDNYSAQTALSNVQQLVLHDHVFAIAPLYSNVATGAVTQISKEDKTPIIGWGSSLPFISNQWAWSINGNAAQTNYASTAQLAQYLQVITGSEKKLAIIGYSNPVAVDAGKVAAAAATSLGAKIVYNEYNIPTSGETNYAPFAQAIVSSGANGVYFVLAGADVAGMSSALKAAGYKGSIESGASYFPGQLASSPSQEAALQGVYVANEFPANQNNTPAVKQAEADLRSVGVSPPYLTTGASVGYWSAKLLISMLVATEKKVGSASKVTPLAVEKLVNSGYTYKGQLAGGIGTESFPQAERMPIACDTMLQIEGANYVQRVPFRCGYKVIRVK